MQQSKPPQIHLGPKMRTYFITHTSEQKHKKDWLSLNFPNMDDWNAIFNQTFYVQYLRFADFTLHCNVRRLPSADASDRVRTKAGAEGGTREVWANVISVARVVWIRLANRVCLAPSFHEAPFTVVQHCWCL